MFPTSNLTEARIKLQQIMDKRGITPKDIKEYLNLTSVQSVYNCCDGLNMPTIWKNHSSKKIRVTTISTTNR